MHRAERSFQLIGDHQVISHIENLKTVVPFKTMSFPSSGINHLPPPPPHLCFPQYWCWKCYWVQHEHALLLLQLYVSLLPWWLNFVRVLIVHQIYKVGYYRSHTSAASSLLLIKNNSHNPQATGQRKTENCGPTTQRIDSAAVGQIKGIPIHPPEGSCSGYPLIPYSAASDACSRCCVNPTAK